jgi:putative membrane protein
LLFSGQAFWQAICAEMEAGFRQGRFGDAIAGAVKKVGAVLAAEFPPRPDDQNELSDDVVDRGVVI